MLAKLVQFNQGLYTKAVLCVRNPLYDSSKESQADFAADAQTMMENVLKASESSANMSAFLAAGVATTSKYNCIEVQYNPETVVISSSGGKYMSMDRSGTIGSASASAVVERNQPVTKKCSFTIILDDMNENDAFGFQGNTSISLSNIASIGMNVYKTATGTNYSVKAKCEALMGLVMQSHLQDMVFCYGKMAFHGQLISCTSNYTMFSLSGKPIRAEIRMTLIQLANADLYAYDVREWRKKWQTAFKTT